MTAISHDASFMTMQAKANLGAYGLNPMKTPTLKMQEAGNYKLGRITIHGLKIAIENPRGTHRGSDYRWMVADHYGYISGYKGNDGDFVDCFVGSNPSSQKAFVINQNNQDGTFDEHKVMLGYDSLSQALLGYQLSYDFGWQGMGSVVECSIPQLRFWLDRGDKSIALRKEALPVGGDYEIPDMLKGIKWHDNGANITIDQMLYQIRRAGISARYGDLLNDSMTMDDILENAEMVVNFDALISPFGKLPSKMEALKKAFAKASSLMSVTEKVEISPPFKRHGTLQVASIFNLTDGQTVSVFFHNPDTTPNKITAQDAMVSWKWMLNKKDITIAVAPEDGKDLPVSEVAFRVMALAQKNSVSFQKLAKKAEKEGKIDNIKALKAQIAELEQKERELIEQVKEVKKAIINGVSIASVSRGDIQSVGGEKATDAVFRWFRNNPTGTIFRGDVGEIIFDENGLNNSLRHGFNWKKLNSVTVISDVIKNGAVIDVSDDFDGKSIANTIIAAPIDIDGVRHQMIVRLRKDTSSKTNEKPNRFYVHEVIMEEEVVTPYKTGVSSEQQSEAGLTRGRNHYISLLRKYIDVNAPDGSDEVRQAYDRPNSTLQEPTRIVNSEGAEPINNSTTPPDNVNAPKAIA